MVKICSFSFQAFFKERFLVDGWVANYKFFVNLISRELFNKWQAQRWWAENYDKVMELYNVQRFNQQAVPLPTPPRSEDDVSSRLM